MLKKHIALALLGTALATVPALAQQTDPGNDPASSSTAPMGTTPPSNTNPSPMSGASSTPSTSGSSMSSGSSASSAPSTSSASATDMSAPKFLTQEGANQWRASKLVGVNVYGPNDAKVGDINEVIIDRDGKVAAVVIGVGGFLGIGEKNVALPYASLQWSDTPRSGRSSTGNGGSMGAGSTASTSNSSADRGYPDHATLTMTKDDLKNAPSFKWSSDRSDSK